MKIIICNIVQLLRSEFSYIEMSIMESNNVGMSRISTVDCRLLPANRPEYDHVHLYVYEYLCIYDDCMTSNKLAAIATLHHLD